MSNSQITHLHWASHFEVQRSGHWKILNAPKCSGTHGKDDLLLMDKHPVGMVQTIMDSDLGNVLNIKWYRILSTNRKSAYIFLPLKNSMIQVSLHHVLHRLETSTHFGTFIGGLWDGNLVLQNFLTLITKFYTIFWCNNMPPFQLESCIQIIQTCFYINLKGWQ